VSTGRAAHLLAERGEEERDRRRLDVDLPVDAEQLALELRVLPFEDLTQDLEVLRRVSDQPVEGEPEAVLDDRGVPRAETEPESTAGRRLRRLRLHRRHEGMARVGRQDVRREQDPLRPSRGDGEDDERIHVVAAAEHRRVEAELLRLLDQRNRPIELAHLRR